MTDIGSSAPFEPWPNSFEPWPDSQVHVEWGPTGAALAAARGDLVVIVDVLSFSTTLVIAVDRGFTCLVYSGAEIEAMGGLEAAAAELGARPLSKRRRVQPGQISLSPQSILTAERGQRVLFTSLNGAAAAGAAAAAPALLVGSLRNATACAVRAARLLEDKQIARVTVVACGEHWSSVEPGITGLRPSLEDWAGAGLICSRLTELGYTLSAEAKVAALAAPEFSTVSSCVSARELVAAGFEDDVTLALQIDASDSVPVRIEGEHTGRAFCAGESTPTRRDPTSRDQPRSAG